MPVTHTVTVGVAVGPHAPIVMEAAKVARASGMSVQVLEYDDYRSPNQALAEGLVDLVIYQHEPFLRYFNALNGTDLQRVADAVITPLGLYSRGIDSVRDIPEGARVSIPDDPSNRSRALLLLQTAGLLVLKDGVGIETAQISDIKDNPLGLKFTERNAAELTKNLDVFDFAVVPMGYAINSGLITSAPGFFFEDETSPFATMIIVARKDNADSPAVQEFIKAYRSEPVKEFVKHYFKGIVRTTW